MLIMSITCAHCGKTVDILHAIKKSFCSRECEFLYNQAHTRPVQSTINHQTESATNDVDDILGESWKRAGLKYDAMTRQALLKEHKATARFSIIIAGNNAGLSVKHDKLIVRHGISYSPQELISEELDHATHNVYRIVWCAATGNISYAALKWCRDQSIDLVVLDEYGDILYESNNNKYINVHVKRAQYNMSQEKLRDIAIWIILGKIKGQFETYQDDRELYDPNTDKTFAWAMNMLSSDTLHTVDDIRNCEMRAADAYFDAWRNIPLQWSTSDKSKIPSHWYVVGRRNSILSRQASALKPISPAQAILNYGYGILEHQAHAALISVGLDAAVGILHTDKPGRDSLIYDLMELGRGSVDAMVLMFIHSNVFKRGEFVQSPDGSVQLHPELARAIAAKCSINIRSLIEWAQILKNMILLQY